MGPPNEHEDQDQDMELDPSLSVESVVSLLAQLDKQDPDGLSIEPKDSIEMSGRNLNPDDLDLEFLGLGSTSGRELPPVDVPSACSHQQSRVFGKHGMPVGEVGESTRRPTSSEQAPSAATTRPGCMYQNPRSTFRGHQLEGLALAYAANPFPSTEDKAALAEELQLDTRAVQVWFQNKRARDRKALGPQATEHLRRRLTKGGAVPPRTIAPPRTVAAVPVAAVPGAAVPVAQPGVEIALSEVLAAVSPAGSESAGSASPKLGPAGARPKRSQVSVAENVRIANDLTVHGEAWKLGGSAQWRVLSDARVKDVLADFRLGGETLLRIVPRLFRYRGQELHERPYVGIIAQEVPEELVPFCRFHTRIGAAAIDAFSAAGAVSPASPPPAAPAAPVAAGTASAAAAAGAVQLPHVAPPVVAVAAEEEDQPGGAPPSWLYLVDLSALQFVLLVTAKGLLRTVDAQEREIAYLQQQDAREVHASPDGQVARVLLDAQHGHVDLAIDGFWLVFSDPEARRCHQREFSPHARKVQKFLIDVGTGFMLLIAAATIASRVNSASDLGSPQFWALQQYELLHPAMGLFFCLAWRTGLPRRHPRVADLLFAAAASFLVCLELSSMCVSHIHGWHEQHGDASAQGEEKGGGNTPPPSSGRAPATGGLSDLTHSAACAQLWLPVDETLVEGFKCDTQRWIVIVQLLLPMIMGQFGIQWPIIVLTHLATAIFFGGYIIRDYPAEGLNAVSPFIFQGRMLMLFSLPSVIVLILVYLRIKTALRVDALLMSQRATAETFRRLYEASQLEPPSRLVAASRETPSEEGGEGDDPRKGAQGVYAPMLL